MGVSRGFTDGHEGLCQAGERQVHRDQALPHDPSAAVHESVPISPLEPPALWWKSKS